MDSVIFLDIDGVLNAVPPVQPVEAEKVHLLAQLIHTTGASIVLHSGWRVWFDSHMRPLREEATLLCNFLAAEGLMLANMTPDLTTEEIRHTKKFSLVKAQEILAWLELHPEVHHWAVLDDLDLHNDVIAAHQVKPNASVGLTIEDTLAARCILQGG